VCARVDTDLLVGGRTAATCPFHFLASKAMSFLFSASCTPEEIVARRRGREEGKERERSRGSVEISAVFLLLSSQLALASNSL